jgi:translation initiation factor IF-3
MYHPERGRSLLLRLADDVKDLAVIEADPLQDGRNMVMMLAPHKEAVAAKPANEAGDEIQPAAEPVSAAQPEETPVTPA